VSDDTYLDPTESTVAALLARDVSGPLAMLNLVRFRETADYSASPELAPAEPITGRTAFDRYVAHTLPFLRDSGGELLFLGTGGSYLVGPSDEGWDLAMLVRQDSVQAFLAFASNQAYMAGIGHRTAAVRDSRILPLADTLDAQPA
jgi:hypothetical protein